MSRHRRPPAVTRARAVGPGGIPAKVGAPAGSRARPLPAGQNAPWLQQAGGLPGMNIAGTNTTPTAAYQDGAPLPSGQGTMPALTSGMSGWLAAVRPRPNAPGTGGPVNAMFAPGDPLRPTPGLDDGAGGPRQWSYPVGVNIAAVPRATEAVAFNQLRALAALYDGYQIGEAVILRILRRLELRVVPRGEVVDAGEDASASKWVEPGLRMADWLMEPDHRGTDMKSWLVAGFRDILQLDALGVYHRLTRAGGLYGLELVAGDSLMCLVDLSGRRPIAPYPAFRQVLYGAPGRMFTADELDYLKMHPRTDSSYGMSAVERILMRVNQELRKQNYDLAWWTEGSTPEGTAETDSPEYVGKMSADQLVEYERTINAILAGNDALRQRIKFMPPGWHYKGSKNPERETAFDAWVFNVALAVLGLTKDEVGFTDTSNRSVGATQENVTYRNAVKPTADFVAEYLTRVIRRYDGSPLGGLATTVSRAGAATKSAKGTWDARYRVEWGGIEEPEDFNAKVSAAGQLVAHGMMGPTEAKRWLRLPVPRDEEPIPAFITPQGGAQAVVFLEDLVAQRDQIKKAHGAQLDAQIAGAQSAASFAQQGPQASVQAAMGTMKSLGGMDGTPGPAGGAPGPSGGPPAPPQGPQGPSGGTPGPSGGQKPAGGGQPGPSGAQTPAKSTAVTSSKGVTVAEQMPAGAQKGAGAPAKGAQAPNKARRVDGEDEWDDASAREREPHGDAQWGPGGELRGGGGWDVGGGPGNALGAPVADVGDPDDGGDDPEGARDASDGARAERRGEGGAGGPVPSGRGGALPGLAARPGGGDAGEEPGGAHGARHELHTLYDRPGGRPDGGPDDRGGAEAGATRQALPGITGQEGGGEESPAQGSPEAEHEAVSEDWRRWRERCLRAVKRGQPIPAFTSTLIPADAQARVRWELVSASTPSDVRTVFAAERAREGAPTSLEAPVVALAAPTPAPASPDVVAALSRAVLEHISQATLVELRGMRADVARALSL